MFIHLGYHEERVLGEGRKRGVEEIYTVKICLMRMISNWNYNRGESGPPCKPLRRVTLQGNLAGWFSHYKQREHYACGIQFS